MESSRTNRIVISIEIFNILVFIDTFYFPLAKHVRLIEYEYEMTVVRDGKKIKYVSVLLSLYNYSYST